MRDLHVTIVLHAMSVKALDGLKLLHEVALPAAGAEDMGALQ